MFAQSLLAPGQQSHSACPRSLPQQNPLRRRLAGPIYLQSVARLIIDSRLQLGAIASIRLVACRGLIASRWKGMSALHARADAAQHPAWASPKSLTPRRITGTSQCQSASLGRTLQQCLRYRSVRAAVLPPVAAAIFHSSAAVLPELSMTKYGAEQEAACRAVRLAAKLCQVQRDTSAHSHCTLLVACITSYAQTVLA